jgi:hypothetical protein
VYKWGSSDSAIDLLVIILIPKAWMGTFMISSFQLNLVSIAFLDILEKPWILYSSRKEIDLTGFLVSEEVKR